MLFFHKRNYQLACLFFFLLFHIYILRYDCLAEGQQVRYTADMTHLPAGADISAMGDAGVVLPRKAAAALWNPASVSMTRYTEISAEIADIYHGLSKQGCFALRFPVQSRASASIMYLPFFSGDIPLFDSLSGTYQELLENDKLRSNGVPLGYFRNNQHLIILSLGKAFNLKLPRMAGNGLPRPFDLSAGLSLKGYWATMDPKGIRRIGAGVNADAGVIASIGLDYDLARKETSRVLMMGITIRDFLPTEIIWVHSPLQYSEKTRYSHYYGIAFVDKSGDLGGNWTFALALDKYYSTTYRVGVEAEFWNTAIFRAGLSGNTPTLGAGVRFKRYFMDYAFRFDKIDFSYLRLTLGAVF